MTKQFSFQQFMRCLPLLPRVSVGWLYYMFPWLWMRLKPLHLFIGIFSSLSYSYVFRKFLCKSLYHFLKNYQFFPLKIFISHIFIYLLLTSPHGLWNLSSLTRDRIPGPQQWKHLLLTTVPPGNSSISPLCTLNSSLLPLLFFSLWLAFSFS